MSPFVDRKVNDVMPFRKCGITVRVKTCITIEASKFVCYATKSKAHELPPEYNHNSSANALHSSATGNMKIS
jgi:hypothetical protein